MRTIAVRLLILIASATVVHLSASEVSGNTIHYEVQPKGLSVKVFYAVNDPASYSEYEVFGPGDTEPYQVGRTDRSGVLSFLPDRQGTWRVKVIGESSHGFHGVTIEVKVDQAFQLESFNKPILAQHTKVVVGLSVIFGLFGLVALYLSRRKRA